MTNDPSKRENQVDTNRNTLNKISALLNGASGDNRHFPPTDLFNEGWMLRLVLDWFHHNPGVEHPLNFVESSNWYSEALFTSPFLSSGKNGKKLAESYTHADGVIGDFVIGKKGVGDLGLLESARQFVVTEAKMYSKLSSGVTNAKYYNQAARNVACMAEIVRQAGVSPTAFKDLAFYVLAPLSRIQDGVFSKEMDVSSIQDTVQKRTREYEEDSYSEWFEEHFLPLIDVIRIDTIAWEEIVTFITRLDSDFGDALGSFYSRCIEFNQYVAKQYR